MILLCWFYLFILCLEKEIRAREGWEEQQTIICRPSLEDESESLLRMSMVELGPWPLGQVESAFWICLLKSISRCFTRYCFLHSASACICHASHGKAGAYLNCTEFSILIWSGKIPRKSWDILSFYWSLINSDGRHYWWLDHKRVPHYQCPMTHFGRWESLTRALINT